MSAQVAPTDFTLVDYDAARIGSIVDRLVAEIGLPSALTVEVDVDETTPLGRARVARLDPDEGVVVLAVESGAFEDACRPRQLSDKSVFDVCGRLLFRVRDRLDPAFGDPPADSDLTLAEAAAWDAHSMGRMSRLGHESQRDRRRYQFRVRHGFSDAADDAFDRLWAGPSLTWPEIAALSASATA